MLRLIVSTICLGALVFCSEDAVKNKTAAGYYGGSAEASTGNYYVPYYPPPPQLEDRNVCDLDATVLLVTDRRRHGQNKAVRVRCSEIANYDEDSCNTCCQNAARRDQSLQNGAMYGFLAVVDNLKQKDSRENSEEEETLRRKRSPRHEGQTGEVDYTTLHQESWKPDAQYKNVKCVCCAPRRALLQPIYQQYQAPAQTYGQPQAAPVQQYPQAQTQQYPQAQAAPVQQYPQVQAQQYQAPAQAAPAYQAQAPVKSY